MIGAQIEWNCCGSVTETESWKPEKCPFCVVAITTKTLDIDIFKLQLAATNTREDLGPEGTN